jgi:hypothetical protein
LYDNTLKLARGVGVGDNVGVAVAVGVEVGVHVAVAVHVAGGVSVPAALVAVGNGVPCGEPVQAIKRTKKIEINQARVIVSPFASFSLYFDRWEKTKMRRSATDCGSVVLGMTNGRTHLGS